MSAACDRNLGAPLRAPGGTPAGLAYALAWFQGEGGAATAFAAACETWGGVPWLHKLVVAEHHPNGRIALRGTLAGQYLEIDGSHRFPATGSGDHALFADLLEALQSPSGLAVGTVGGASVGLPMGSRSDAEPDPSRLVERLRKAVPRRSSVLPPHSADSGD